SLPQFLDDRARRAVDGGRDALSVGAIEFLTDGAQLTLLEFTDRDAAPPVGRANDRSKHQLQYRALAEGVRDDLRAPSFLEEEAFEEIGGSDHLAVTQRKSQMGNARVEIIGKHCTTTGHSRALLDRGAETGRSDLPRTSVPSNSAFVPSMLYAPLTILCAMSTPVLATDPTPSHFGRSISSSRGDN